MNSDSSTVLNVSYTPKLLALAQNDPDPIIPKPVNPALHTIYLEYRSLRDKYYSIRETLQNKLIDHPKHHTL